MDLFKRANKQKLRFTSPRGPLCTEDLWDIPLTDADTSLNNIAKGLNKELNTDSEEDFVKPKVKPNPKTVLKFDLNIVGVTPTIIKTIMIISW